MKRWWLPLLSLALLGGGLSRLSAAETAPQVPRGSTPREVELGEEGAKEVAREYKFVKDPATEDRLMQMVKVLAPHSERPDIKYTVKIIDDKTINAFTLPGGHIYVTKGLLDFVASDHELAAVLAHEIAHNAHMDALKALAKEKKMQLWQLLSVLGAVVTGSGDIAVMSQYVTLAILNGYGEKAESAADAGGFSYMLGTPYNPVGMMTFLERLLDYESRRPPGPDPGIFRTHPPTADRVAAIRKLLEEHGIPIDRRAVTRAGYAVAEPVTGDPTWRVALEDQPLFRLGGSHAEERARQAAASLNAALHRDLRAYQLSVRETNGTVDVLAQGEPLVTATSDDLTPDLKTVRAVALRWKDNLSAALWSDVVDSSHR